MQTLKRSLSMFMVLVMLVAFVPALSLGASAAEVDYKYNGSYIYNWGTRGTVATFLSPNAEDFYEDNNTSYNELSSLSGGTGKSDAPKSALYHELQDLMESNHSYKTSYDATKNLFQYTDCQNGGGKISSFYSGNAIGPSWNGGWNREHTWPDSKGNKSSDSNDIMMLRPTSTSENGARGNKAYGQSSGYYNPNAESNNAYDLRGDVARIFLYVYVRWGIVDGNGSYSTWGSNGVMESVEVLLDWMEEDPVDTWELGRNDSVESITGTRNVFVDYPEFAFLLFGEEIPADMQTPSSANASCGHNNYDSGVVTAPTCTARGFTLYTCKTVGCGSTYKADFVAAKGHTYTNDVCSVCGEAKPVKPTYTTSPEIGKAYKLGLFSTTEYFFTGSMVSTYYGASDTDYAKGVDVYLEQANGGYYLYFKNSSGQKQYINIVASNDYRNFSYSSTATSVFVWDTAKNTLKTTVAGGYCYIGNYGSHSSMNGLKESNLKDTDYLARLYTMDGESGGNPSDNPSTPPEETTPNTPDTPNIPDTPNTPDIPVGESVTASKTVANLITEYGWTGTTTKQEFKLDANVTVKINGGDNSGKPYNNNHIRIYATDTPAGTMTISLADGYELVSIKISAQTGTYAYLCLDGTTTDISNESIAVSGSSVVLNTVKNGSGGKHVRVTAIEVVYSSLATSPDIPEGTTPEPEVTTPEPEVTTPEPEVTTPEPEVTTPEPEETTPEETVPEESTPAEPETPDNENTTEKKEHVCEEVNGFRKFINSIINFFRRLFGQPEICTCGEIINKED